MTFEQSFDVVLINDDLEQTLKQAEQIVALLQEIPEGKGDELLDLLTNRINPVGGG